MEEKHQKLNFKNIKKSKIPLSTYLAGFLNSLLAFLKAELVAAFSSSVSSVLISEIDFIVI